MTPALWPGALCPISYLCMRVMGKGSTFPLMGWLSVCFVQ